MRACIFKTSWHSWTICWTGRCTFWMHCINCGLNYIQYAALCSSSRMRTSHPTPETRQSQIESCSAIHGKLCMLWVGARLPLIGGGRDCDVISPPFCLSQLGEALCSFMDCRASVNGWAAISPTAFVCCGWLRLHPLNGVHPASALVDAVNGLFGPAWPKLFKGTLYVEFLDHNGKLLLSYCQIK